MIDTYIEWFKKLKCSARAGRRAPHKPIMLLSIMDMIETGDLNGNKFFLDDQLRSRFATVWNQYLPNEDVFKPNPEMPFQYMVSEPFWTGDRFTWAKLREDLWSALQNPQHREILKKVLINTYLGGKSISTEAEEIEKLIDYLQRNNFPISDEIRKRQEEIANREVLQKIEEFTQEFSQYCRGVPFTLKHKRGQIELSF